MNYKTFLALTSMSSATRGRVSAFSPSYMAQRTTAALRLFPASPFRFRRTSSPSAHTLHKLPQLYLDNSVKHETPVGNPLSRNIESASTAHETARTDITNRLLKEPNDE